VSQDDEAQIRALCRRTLEQEPHSIALVPAGLGLRRFYRVRLPEPPHTLIARIEADEDPSGRPPGVAPEPPLEPTRRLFETAGLPVPRNLGMSDDTSVTLLEDGGEMTLEDLHRADPKAAEVLLGHILDDLVTLQQIEDPGDCPAFERKLDAPLFAYKAELFATWALPELLGRPATAAERTAVNQAFHFISSVCEAAPRRLSHRDFQSRNLLVRDGRVLWIDLQGALLAPPEYDLVCLLRDSYIEWPEPIVERSLSEVRPRLPDAPSSAEFDERFSLLTLTRKGKDLARFLYVAATRGDEDAPRHVPTTLRQLQRAAASVAGAHPALEPLLGFIHQHALGAEP
jgi:hypothetical protein